MKQKEEEGADTKRSLCSAWRVHAAVGRSVLWERLSTSRSQACRRETAHGWRPLPGISQRLHQKCGS